MPFWHYLRFSCLIGICSYGPGRSINNNVIFSVFFHWEKIICKWFNLEGATIMIRLWMIRKDVEHNYYVRSPFESFILAMHYYYYYYYYYYYEHFSAQVNTGTANALMLQSFIKRRTGAFEQRYRRSRLDTDRLAWITQARKKQQLFASKQSLFWERKISESKGDPKKIWRNLSSLMRKGKTKPPTSDELTAERSLEAATRNWPVFDPRLHQLLHRFSAGHHANSAVWNSNLLMPLQFNVSYVKQPASQVSLTRSLPGSSKSMQRNYLHSSLHCLMHRWGLEYSLHPRN